MMKTGVVKPMFSIITICLNNKDGLIRTYNSLKAQSCNAYEWIVVDGVSTDGTVDFLQALPKSNSLIWKSEPDSGLYDAMNKGMSYASGKYLLFLNSGDELATNHILALVKETAEEQSFPSLVYGDAYEFDENQRLILKKAYDYRRIWYGMFAHHQSMFFHSDFLPEKYNTDFTYASDYEFVATHLKNNSNVVYLPEAFCKFEFGGISQTGSTKVADLEQWEVRRRILDYSWFRCFMVSSLHKISHFIRGKLPFVYRYLRFSNSKETQ